MLVLRLKVDSCSGRADSSVQFCPSCLAVWPRRCLPSGGLAHELSPQGKTHGSSFSLVFLAHGPVKNKTIVRMGDLGA